MLGDLPIPLLGPGVVQVWHARVAAFARTRECTADPHSGECGYHSLLSDEERNRAGRFVFDASRDEFVLGRALVRLVLSTNLNVAPRELQVRLGPYGKPELDCEEPSLPIHFNLSHSAGLVVAAFSRDSALGVDVEDAERTISPAVRRQVFTPEELRSWESLPPDEQRAAAAARWTLKEAWLKARGAGLNLPLLGFAFENSPAEPRIHFSAPIDDDPARWRFYQTRLAPRHVVSLAWRDSQAAVELHDFDPHLSIPPRMTDPANISSLSAEEKRRLLSEVLRRKQEDAQPADRVTAQPADRVTAQPADRIPEPKAAWPRRKPLEFGLMFFGGDDALGADKYKLLIESARFADSHGLASIWLPERHFIKFGCLYPNPAVLHAALARETKRIRLRAGSVVMPLQNPIRVAEEWAVVDVISGGRVDISFASGWHPDDFVFAPEKYADRKGEMLRGIETVRKLWRGEQIEATSASGQKIEVRTYPTPLQKELNVFLTAAGNPETFEKAGEIGAGVVTHLFDQRIDDLAEKIQTYRAARAKHGFDPETGTVAVTLHTFIGQSLDEVRATAGGPYCNFLKENLGLLKNLAFSRGMKVDVSALPPAELDELLNAVFEKFLGSRSLLGTPETCLEMSRQLAAAGVDEVACLLDFGPAEDAILRMLPQLAQLRERCAAAIV